MKKGRGKSVAALLAALMAAAPVCGERFNARLPMKVYLRSREGLPDRLLGFTPATPQHPVTRPREGIWYVQPTGPLSNAHAKSLGAILRTRGVPGVDFSDHWDLTDDRFERIGRQPQLRYLNVSRTPLTDRAMRLVGKWT